MLPPVASVLLVQILYTSVRLSQNKRDGLGIIALLGKVVQDTFGLIQNHHPFTLAKHSCISSFVPSHQNQTTEQLLLSLLPLFPCYKQHHTNFTLSMYPCCFPRPATPHHTTLCHHNPCTTISSANNTPNNQKSQGLCLAMLKSLFTASPCPSPYVMRCGLHCRIKKKDQRREGARTPWERKGSYCKTLLYFICTTF